MDTINIDGHAVPVDRADQFFHGSTGHRISDAEWDESKRRVAEAEALEGEAAVTWAPIEGSES